MTASKELQAREKQELATSAEQTRPGLVFTPEVDIFEEDREITLLADMPGVAANDISIDLQDGVLTLTGDVKPWKEAEECDVLIEFEIGKYYRQFTLSDAINQDKINAKLEDGVLRLTLPKAQKAVPRQITVTSG
ncbi:MAG: Hsp20/alpha crystallin family protein [Desulfobulbaceae bacterium]|jgi:HSP20 family molecular chaperone IbpA|nr:Hsp20/alpha crystallin family protein [Desulfobulbaceae bacterium]